MVASHPPTTSLNVSVGIGISPVTPTAQTHTLSLEVIHYFVPPSWIVYSIADNQGFVNTFGQKSLKKYFPGPGHLEITPKSLPNKAG
jgi:hypothetical protein